MRVRITRQQPAGAVLNGQPWPDEGEETDLPTALGAHLVASGVAEEVADAEEKPKRRSKPRARGEGAT
ncbi:hypothetical protein [Streptomyces caniscabiei]|uniref:hypothetical protein n=1 Tax=Streptomyces caniscabiei TaxID=2746961 RepID=UPI0029B254C8|nr:hypothetical protein [Streptomyces caniscabiei]MDX2948893.1 hypothetical protein [Streptomyces caniscabiei]